MAKDSIFFSVVHLIESNFSVFTTLLKHFQARITIVLIKKNQTLW